MKKTIVAVLCAAVFIVTGHADAYAGQGKIFAAKSQGSAKLNLDGVQGFVAGQTKSAFSELMTESVSRFMSGALIETARERGMLDDAGRISLPRLFAQSPELKEAVRQKIKESIKNWLPGAVRDLVREHVFQNALGSEHAKDVEQLLGYISDNFETSFNAQADNLIDGWYTGYVGDIRRRVMEGTFTGWLDVTNLRGSIHNVLSTSSIMEGTSWLLSRELGESTVSGIQDNLEAMLGGELAPAVAEYLEMGEKKFDEFEAWVRDKIGGHLPSSYVSRLQNSLLNRPLFKMPSSAYGAILAAMAAKHYAAAFKGMFVDAHELRRGIEVTRVMVWQLREKKNLNVKLMDLAGLSASFGSTLGLDAWQGVLNNNILAQLDKLKELSAKLDELIMKPFDLVGDQIQRITDEITQRLTDLQNALMAPVQDAMASFDESLTNIADGIGGMFPENFNGIPPNWQNFKDTVGMEGIFGEWGELTPRDLVERLGTMDDFQLMGEQLNELNDRIADAGAGVAAEILEELHLLGPASVLLGIEEVPARNPSDTSELDPVLLHNGEFVHRVTDVVIPGRGFDTRVTRIYRSRSSFLGPFGRNWTHAYAERLLPWDGEKGPGWTYVRPDGMKFFFKELPDGSFESPRDIFLKLVRTEKGFELTDPHGNVTTFYALGLLREKRDTFGNRIRCLYNDKGWLMAVVDPVGRPLMFRYNDNGLIVGMEDIAGRTWAYEYDDKQNLIVVRSPVTVEFPLGKRTEYRYTSGYRDEALNHNLKAIMDPKGQLALLNKYGTTGSGYDRVIEQRYGDREQRLYVQYDEVKAEVKVEKGEKAKAHAVASRAYVTDRRGIMHVYEQDAAGHLLAEWIVPVMYEPTLVSYHRYDDEGRQTFSCKPSGGCVQYDYDDSTVLSRGDVVAVHEIPLGDGKPRTTRIIYDKIFHKPVRIIGPTENARSFSYGEQGALVSACNEADACSAFTYNRYGQVVEKIDPRGVVSDYTYHDDGYLAQVIVDARDHRKRTAYGEPIKSTTSFAYDDVGNVIREIDPLGRTTDYRVNALNQIVRERLPDGSERRYAFDPNENLIRAELIKGDERVLREFEYDSLDNLTARIAYPDPKTKVITRYKYDPSGNLIKTIFPQGNSTIVERDAWGRPTCESFGQDMRCVEYNQDGVPILRTENGGAESVALDAFGRWQFLHDARGTETMVERDRHGRITSYAVVSKGGVLLKKGSFSYTSAGYMNRRVRSWWRREPRKEQDVVERLDYDVVGNVVRTMDPLGSEKKFSYDGLGNLVRMEDPTGMVRTYERDSLGRVLARAIEDRRYSYEYDAAGNRSAVTDPLGARTSYTYNVAGDLVSTTDPLGTVTRYETDGMGRVTKVVAKPAKTASDVVTSYTWDGNNRLATLTDSRGAVTHYSYDDQDRATRISFPDGSEVKHRYIDDDWIISTDRAGNTHKSIYDKTGLLTSLEVHGPDRVSRLEQQYSYDALGRLADAKDGDVAVYFNYDSLDNVYREAIGGHSIERAHDVLGNMTALIYPTGGRLDYTYDKASRLVSVIAGDTTVWQQTYEGLWPVKQRLINGVSEERTFDKLGRTLTERLKSAKGLKLDEKTYAYDAVGNLVNSTRRITGATCSYDYDGMRRLIAADCGGDITRYELDGAGSWASTNARGNAVHWKTDVMNAYVAAASKAGEVFFSYDNNGNLISDGEHLYKYDPLGRLIEVRTAKDGSLVARYAYDAFGRRVRKEVEGKSIDVVFNGWNEIGEYIGRYNDRIPIAEYINGVGLDRRLAVMFGDRISFLHADRLGSVISITNEKGEHTDAYSYDPYGKRYRIEGLVSSNAPNPFAYTGRILDETGLMQYRYRYYHPLMGRFTSIDPLGYKNTQYAQTTGSVALGLSYHKGFGWSSQSTLPNRSARSMAALPETYPFKRWRETWSAFSPGESNLYLYAAANPLSFIDPMGLAHLIFDRSEGLISVHRGDMDGWTFSSFRGDEGYSFFRGGAGSVYSMYRAHNNTVPSHDPKFDSMSEYQRRRTTGSNSPAPNGVFTVSKPRFRDERARDSFYAAHADLGAPRSGEYMVSGADWLGPTVTYNGEPYERYFGNVRFRVGAVGPGTSEINNIAYRRQIFIHGGRRNRGDLRTLGCIRMYDEDIDDLVQDFIQLDRENDPVTHLFIQD